MDAVVEGCGRKTLQLQNPELMNSEEERCLKEDPKMGPDVSKEGEDQGEHKMAAKNSSRPPQTKGNKARNPFMPHKLPMAKKPTENLPGSLLDDLSVIESEDKTQSCQLDGCSGVSEELQELQEGQEDSADLMVWWDTVEEWGDVRLGEYSTGTKEVKEFALTAEKVQKGIRVFNKLFTEWAEGLWQHVMDLHGIADGIDRFNKGAKIASITGGSTSIVGGVATIAGLALAPFTLGTSLIVTAVGLGVAAAGGLTSASASISNTVSNSQDRKKVERIVEDYQAKMADITKCTKFIKKGIENLRRYDLAKMKNHALSKDLPSLNNIYEDGAMAGKAIISNAAEIMRVVQIANAAGTTAARAVQVASMATGVLAGLFVGMDIYFVAKDSLELKKGAKTEFAGKIREVASQLQEGLVELNSIRQELHSVS